MKAIRLQNMRLNVIGESALPSVVLENIPRLREKWPKNCVTEQTT